jgi:hypothetical protein
MFLINHEWLYVHIPKTSGTNLKNRFIQSKNIITEDDNLYWISYTDWYKKSLIGKVVDSNIILLGWYVFSKHIPLFMWEDKIEEKNLKTFATVRNPYTLVVSSYNKFSQVLSSGLFSKVDKNISFKDFYQHPKIIELRKSFPFNQTITQSSFLKGTNFEIKCDKIYKMENELITLEEDFSLTHINTYKFNTLDYNKNYSEIYDDEMIKWVQEIYEEDFNNFNYDLDPFW